MEWDNARSSENIYDEATGTSTWQDRGDMYDFEIIYNLNYRHGEGQYEIVMAYDNIEFGNEAGAGSIGVKGYDGFRASFGPASGYLGTQFALDDLRDKVTDGLVTCYDYQGPETSAFQLSFQVRVNNAATGTVQPVQVEVTRDGQASDTLVQPLDIRGNLKLGELSDLSIAEDTELKGLQVVYSDDNNVANTISVSGDNISATVQGHTSGSLINVKPAKDFSGTTTVTVTVTDNEHPSDKVSTSFKLTVAAAEDAPAAAVAQNTLSATAGDTVTLDASSSKDADGDKLTYSWSGPGTIANANAAKATVTGLSAGSHVFTVTVSDGKAQSTATVTVTVAAAPVTTTPEPAKSSSGGSFGWWSLLLLGLLRRSK